MDENKKTIIRECVAASAAGRVSFGEVVKRLMEAGIERYHVDFVRGDTTYYLPNGDFEVLPTHTLDAVPAATFSGLAMEAAIRGVQSGTLTYSAFCERASQAGCVGYMTSIVGKRVVYYGRTGDSHMEWFPGAKKD